MTIQELQDFINTKPDIRQLINVMADFLQANPGGSPLPDQAGMADKILISNGTDAFWVDAPVATMEQVLASPNAKGLGINNLGSLRFNNTGYFRIYSPDGTPYIVTMANGGTFSIVDDS